MKNKKKKWVFISISFLVVFFTVWIFVEPYFIKTNELKIQSKDIPKSFDGFRIVFISDIHHGPYFSLSRVDKIVEEINTLNPDLVILGGDYVHREKKYIVPVFNSLKNINAKYGVFAVAGNHDHWEDINLTYKMMKEAEINNCDNKSYWVNIGSERIKIGGVGDYYENTQILDSTSFDVEDDDFCILISHSPDYIKKMETDKVDLTLSGHTHGGQISLFGFYAPIVPSEYGQKYRYGLVNTGKMQTYITSGIGTITPPIRFFCRSEIVVLELERE
jgi:hypothetical protein